MAGRNVKDTGGRVWACREDEVVKGSTPHGAMTPGQDVSILCTTASVTVPVRLTIGWQWSKMSDNGLARLITDVSPVPKRAVQV